MFMTPETDLLPPELGAIVDLFTTELAKVTFPDVDAAALKRELEVVRTRAAEVQRAREAVVIAEAALAQRTEALAQLATRGLAYARIYAEAHPEIARRLAEIASPSATATEAPAKRRGRPPKAARAELPFEQPTLPAA
jgi:hypothetical protein